MNLGVSLNRLRRHAEAVTAFKKAVALKPDYTDAYARLGTTLVRIGAGSWVGSGAIIMANVGPECIIGAGSVVTRDVPARVLAAGVPARVIRSRTPEAAAQTGAAGATQTDPIQTDAVRSSQ